MAILRREIVMCNRCGKQQTVPEQEESMYLNGYVAIYGEGGERQDFFLCGECLSRVIDIINGHEYFESVDLLLDLNKDLAKTEDPEKVNVNYLVDAPQEENKDEWDPYKDHKREYIKWDDFELNRVCDLRRAGRSWIDICKVIKCTQHQINNLTLRVRNSKPGSRLYEWKLKYPDVFEAGRTCNKINKILGDLELIDTFCSLKSEGHSLNDIADLMNISKSTLYRVLKKLKDAKPGDEYYKLYEKWGYSL